MKLCISFPGVPKLVFTNCISVHILYHVKNRKICPKSASAQYRPNIFGCVILKVKQHIDTCKESKSLYTACVNYDDMHVSYTRHTCTIIPASILITHLKILCCALYYHHTLHHITLKAGYSAYIKI